MKSNHGALTPSTPSSTPRVSSSAQDEWADTRLSIALRVVIGSAVLLAAIALSMMLSSCGGSHQQTADVGSGVAEAQPVTPVATTTPSHTDATPASSENDMDDPAEGLAPDIGVTADSVAAPGSSVEIVADATSDVAEVLLWDGLHDKQPFVYDMAGKVWRTTYRVPLRPMSERLGLSVTARNTSNRWRRVWVFVNVHKQIETTQEQSIMNNASPDTLSE